METTTLSGNRGAPNVAVAGGYATVRTAGTAGRTLHRIGAACAMAGVLGTGLVGCCNEQKSEMERLGDKFYEQAFKCCEMMAPGDPSGAAECFQSLKDWRTSTGDKIIAWYQACLAGNKALADSILEALRQIAADGPPGDCPTTIELADGRRMAVGVPLVASDTIELRGTLTTQFGALKVDDLNSLLPQRDSALSFQLGAGTFTLDTLGLSINGTLDGECTVIERVDGSYAVVDALFVWGAGHHAVTMRLADPMQLSRVSFDGQTASLEVRVSTDLGKDAELVLPPVLWLDIPLVVRNGQIELARGPQRAVDVIPPALGWADWNDDTFVDQSDWVAFLTTPPLGDLDRRDLNLDGVFDAEDIGRFLRSWREHVVN